MLNIQKIILTEKHDVFLKPQRIFTHKDKDKYIKNIEHQFKKLENYLPNKCKNLLSIGCGLAVPELTFYEYYNKNINFFLFDKTLIDNKIHFGYQKEASFYNDLNEAKSIYVKYGVNENNINLINAENKNLEKLPQMDIIVSFIAWGFHFPLETYLDNVIKLMHNNTILIIDIRRHTNETLANDNTEKLISEHFKIINKQEGNKSDRYIFKLK